MGCKPIEINGERHEFLCASRFIPGECVITSAFGAIVSAEQRFAIFADDHYKGRTKEAKNRRHKRDETLTCIPVRDEFELITEFDYCFFDTSETGYYAIEWICRRPGVSALTENGVAVANPPNVKFLVRKPLLPRDDHFPWMMIVQAAVTIPDGQFLMADVPLDGAMSTSEREYKQK